MKLAKFEVMRGGIHIANKCAIQVSINRAVPVWLVKW
jgi:hypothetical protein